MATISPAILVLEIVYSKFYGDLKMSPSMIESEMYVDYMFEIRCANVQIMHVILLECHSISSTHDDLVLEMST